MKQFFTALILLSCCIFVSLDTRAQSVGCSNDTVFINTGLDHSTGLLDTVGSLDPTWIVQSGPGTSQLAFPAPAYVVPQYSGWHYTWPGTQWLSPFNYAAYGVNNLDTPYVFRYSFCLAQPTSVRVFLIMQDDDLVSVYVDNTFLDTTSVGYNFILGNQDTVNTVLNLSAGTHNLDVHLYNVGGIAMGMDFSGFLTGVGMIGDTCCVTTGSCGGNIFDDHNCDGNQDPGNGGLPNDGGIHGCRVAMTGTGGNHTTTTDRLGNYSFVNLNPGIYNIVTKTPSGLTVDSSNVTIGKLKAVRKDVAVCSSLLAVGSVSSDQSYFRCYPNPARSVVQMDYAIVEPSAVSLHITDVQGQEVLTPMLDENKTVGQYHQTININQLPAGLYFYEFKTDRTYTGKFVKQ